MHHFSRTIEFQGQTKKHLLLVSGQQDFVFVFFYGSFSFAEIHRSFAESFQWSFTEEVCRRIHRSLYFGETLPVVEHTGKAKADLW